MHVGKEEPVQFTVDGTWIGQGMITYMPIADRYVI